MYSLQEEVKACRKTIEDKTGKLSEALLRQSSLENNAAAAVERSALLEKQLGND